MSTLDTFTPSAGIPNGNTSTFLEELLATLQAGLAASNIKDSYCCPSCVEETSGEGIYFLADIPMTLQLLNALGYTKNGSALSCCMNTVTQINSPNALALAEKVYKYEACVNNFLDCYNELSVRLGKDCCASLEANGLVEYNTLTGTNTGSQICTVLQYLLSVNPSLSDAELCTAFSKLLQYGIVIRCKDGKVIITDGCTYMNELLPCTCWEIMVPEGTFANVTTDCPCPDPLKTVPVYGVAQQLLYFCGRNVYADSDEVKVTNLGTACGDCDLYVPCYCYEIVYNKDNITDTVYTDCSGNVQTFTPEVYGTYKICSRVLPTMPKAAGLSILPTITNLGLCEANPECAFPPCYCWEFEAVQGCEIIGVCQGKEIGATMIWNGAFAMCSEQAPTSLCPITPVKVTTCSIADRDCWDKSICRCFTIVTTTVSTIEVTCNDITTNYEMTPAGTYTFCASQVSSTDQAATLTLNTLDCATCTQVLPTKCYDVVVPISAGSVNIIVTDASGVVTTPTFTPGMYQICSSVAPVSLSPDPKVMINIAADDCIKCESVPGCYCWQIEWKQVTDPGCPILNVTTFCDGVYTTDTYTVDGTYVVYSTVAPLINCGGVVVTVIGMYDPITDSCVPLVK